MKSMDIINLANKEFKKKEITLTYGDKEFKVSIEERFKTTDISSLIKDLMERSNYCVAQKIEFDVVQTTYLLLIKYFTDVQFSKLKTLEKQYAHELDVLSALINLGLFKQIIEAFDEKQINKVENMLIDYKTKLIEETKKYQEMQKMKEVDKDGEILN